MLVNALVGASLILISLLYSFDEFGINGIIPLIREHFTLTDSQTAIIQTATSIAHTGTLALVWLFGDSFKRRTLYFTSVLIWIAFSIAAPVLGSKSFFVLVAFRAFSAVAAAVFNVLVPVMLADLYQDRALGIALTVQYFCMTMSGLVSMTVSSWVVTSGINWQLPLLAIPIVALAPFLFLICAKRTLKNTEQPDKGIAKNFSESFGVFRIKSYVLLTAAGALANFHQMGYNFWFPSMYLIVWENLPDVFFGMSFPSITMINTIVMLTAMGIGFPPVLWLAQSWRHGTGPFAGRGPFLTAYPIVVATGSFLTSSMFVISIMILNKSYVACVVVTFLVGLATAADVSLVQQMILMVVSPTHRTAAVALNRLISAIALVPSAQVIGMLTDMIKGDSTLPMDRFHAFQIAMLCLSSLLLISVICYGSVIFFFDSDCKRAEDDDSQDEKKPLLTKHRSESVFLSDQ